MATQHFPAVWSVLAADALAAQVLSQYPLGGVPTCEFIRSGLNDTYRVRDGSQSYYLRVYVHGWRELRDIEAEVALLNHLHAHELPVSHPIATLNGEYILALNAVEGVRYAVLFSAADGRMREETDHRSTIYGRLAGQIHVCADRLPHGMERFHIDHELLLDAPLRRIKPLLAHRPKDYDYLLDTAGRLKARVDELLSKESPEYGICHAILIERTSISTTTTRQRSSTSTASGTVGGHTTSPSSDGRRGTSDGAERRRPTARVGGTCSSGDTRSIGHSLPPSTKR
jgi:Ser/Thr protein kinase RdoA (MazF antagonist)